MLQLILLWLPLVIISITINVLVVKTEIDKKSLKDYALMTLMFTLMGFVFTILWSINSLTYITLTGQISSVLSAIAIGQLAPAILVISRKNFLKK